MKEGLAAVLGGLITGWIVYVRAMATYEFRLRWRSRMVRAVAAAANTTVGRSGKARKLSVQIPPSRPSRAQAAKHRKITELTTSSPGSLGSVSPSASCTQPETALRRLALVMALLSCHGPRLEKLVFCRVAEKAIRGTA